MYICLLSNKFWCCRWGGSDVFLVVNGRFAAAGVEMMGLPLFWGMRGIVSMFPCLLYAVYNSHAVH